MSKINKLIGAILGGIAGLLVVKFGLPEGLADPSVIDPLAALIGSALGTFFAPKNAEA